MLFEQCTRFVDVSVRPIYLREQSSDEDGLFVWAYEVQITNNRKDSIQLLNRAWEIEDGEGHVKEVKGPGVVGKRPILRPGDTFKYSSFTMLGTPMGKMTGTYEMQDGKGNLFSVVIPEFPLQFPCRLVKPLRAVNRFDFATT